MTREMQPKVASTQKHRQLIVRAVKLQTQSTAHCYPQDLALSSYFLMPMMPGNYANDEI